MPIKFSDYEKSHQNVIVDKFLIGKGSKDNNANRQQAIAFLRSNPDTVSKLAEQTGITIDGEINEDFDGKNLPERDSAVLDNIRATIKDDDKEDKETKPEPEDSKDDPTDDDDNDAEDK